VEDACWAWGYARGGFDFCCLVREVEGGCVGFIIGWARKWDFLEKGKGDGDIVGDLIYIGGSSGFSCKLGL
jgi:hypothetical protein